MKLLLVDELATENLAKQLAGLTPEQLVIYLYGDLGAGKTSLVRYFMRAQGYQGLVKSPTYTLVEPYDLPTLRVLHYDLYRLASPQELEFIGIRDYLEQPAVHFIEWPERGEGYLPTADINCMLTVLATGEREVLLQAKTELGDKLVASVGRGQ